MSVRVSFGVSALPCELCLVVWLRALGFEALGLVFVFRELLRHPMTSRSSNSNPGEEYPARTDKQEETTTRFLLQYTTEHGPDISYGNLTKMMVTI